MPGSSTITCDHCGIEFTGDEKFCSECGRESNSSRTAGRPDSSNDTIETIGDRSSEFLASNLNPSDVPLDKDFEISFNIIKLKMAKRYSN
jgi:hypothetical protein